MVRPITSEKHTPSRPMVSEMRAPYTMRENRSRPMRSVPSRKTTPPSATANRWRSVGNNPQNRYSGPRPNSRTG